MSQDYQKIQDNPDNKGIALFIRSDAIGRGDDELGVNLMVNFAHYVTKTEPTPKCIIFMNAGVRLVVEGSDVLDDLGQLEANGVSILACGTCLNYFGLENKLQVGKKSNMAEITKALFEASKVITV